VEAQRSLVRVRSYRSWERNATLPSRTVLLECRAFRLGNHPPRENEHDKAGTGQPPKHTRLGPLQQLEKLIRIVPLALPPYGLAGLQRSIGRFTPEGWNGSSTLCPLRADS